MAYWNDYYTPTTVEEAVAILQKYDGKACMVGGGTDLLLEIQQGHRPKVEALIDPTRIVGLDQIVEEDGYIVIGAGVTHTRIVNDPRIRRQATCLAESCGVIGGPQVRKVGRKCATWRRWPGTLRMRCPRVTARSGRWRWAARFRWPMWTGCAGCRCRKVFWGRARAWSIPSG
jgi:hypothetical protein